MSNNGPLAGHPNSTLDFARESVTKSSVPVPRCKVTPDERERMNWLCLRIQEEKNPKTFDELVHELNELLEDIHGRIHSQNPPIEPR